MSSTSGTQTNGKYIHDRAEVTGATRSIVESIPGTIEIRPAEREEPSQEKIDVKSLYEVYSQRKGILLESTLAIIADSLGGVLERIRKALSEDTELQRENHVAVALDLFFQTRSFLGAFSGFDDGYTMLMTAFIGHRSAVYTVKELRAVEKGLELLRRSPNLTTDEVALLSDNLERAGFDLNAPLAGVELDEVADHLE